MQTFLSDIMGFDDDENPDYRKVEDDLTLVFF